MKLMVELPARDDSYDYKFFGKECDAIVLLNFDQHWVSSPPGPIAAQDWFVENLRQALQLVPAQKIVVGIANFAYGLAASSQPEMVVRHGIQRARSPAARLRIGNRYQFDDTALNPHYSYVDENNRVHQVWMLDAVTGYNQLRASERMGVQGTMMFRLGHSDTFHLEYLGCYPAQRRYPPKN